MASGQPCSPSVPVERHAAGTSVPPAGAALESRVRADQQCALPHAADSGALVAQSEAATVVGSASSDTLPRRAARPSSTWRSVGVPGDVGQPFLGDPVDHEFGLLVQRGEAGSNR